MEDLATIQLDHLHTALIAAKMRQANHGRTCQLCVVTAEPAIQLECRRRGKTSLERARDCGTVSGHVSTMKRGHISRVFERVQVEHGGAEARKTWGKGIRALRAEPRWILNGGSAA